jgi:ribosomal protein L37AE/L43A
MSKNRKAGAGDSGSKTNFTANEIQAFSVLDYTEELSAIQSIIKDRIKPIGKVVRCYRCLLCERSYAASRMSNLLIVCRDCQKQTQGKGKIARQNQIDRIKHNLGIFLTHRLETR